MRETRIETLRQRVGALSPEQRSALARAIAGRTGKPPRLIAFLTPVADVSSDALSEFLRKRLPAYMVPSRFIRMESLPRASSGKLDRRALRGLEQNADPEPTEIVQARTPEEAILTRIWSEVLGVPEVSVNDDFFEIGGDSLLSIRVIARAAREGIRIDPEAFFERPTIAQMAGGAVGALDRPTHDPSGDDESTDEGSAPLTPIQAWFFERITDGRERWNQCVQVELPASLGATELGEIMNLIVRHHAALRLGFSRDERGWRQRFERYEPLDLGRGVETEPGSVHATTHLERRCLEEQESMVLEEGRLFRIIPVQTSSGALRVVMVAHHLLVDAVSWDILLDDLSTLVSQACGGQHLRLPAPTISPRSWTGHIAERAQDPEVIASAAHWLAQPQGPTLRVPIDGPRPEGANRTEDAASHTLRLPLATTRALLHDQPHALDATVYELLIAGLALGWRAWTGQSHLLIDVEGHGRDTVTGVDASRTVGWFTTVFPVWLGLASESPQAAIVEARASTRATPPGGFHGLLRHSGPDREIGEALGGLQRPEILFNYLGSVRTQRSGDSLVRRVPSPDVAWRSPHAPRAYVMELNARVEDDVLTVDIEYSRALQTPDAIHAFAAALERALIELSRADPDPFAWAGLGDDDLDRIGDLLAEVDDE